MAQYVSAIAAKTDDLSSSLGTRIVEEKNRDLWVV